MENDTDIFVNETVYTFCLTLSHAAFWGASIPRKGTGTYPGYHLFLKFDVIKMPILKKDSVAKILL